MAILVHYVRDTGAIIGTWDGPPHLLEAQVLQDDAQYGTLRVPAPGAHDVRHLQERYEVHGGAVQAKTQITIEADPLTFVADGLDECLVTVAPWHACTLLVNGVAYPLTEDEPMLLITSDVSQTFVLILAPMPGIWAEPLQVEAITDATT